MGIKTTLNDAGDLTVEAADYKSPTLPSDVRAADLLKRMSLEEKIAQMLCIWNDKNAMVTRVDGALDFHALTERYANGLGQIGRLSDTAGGLSAVETAELANALQKFFVEETRLGIPLMLHEECLHGLAGREATSYPQPIGLAATFNPALVERIYTAIAEDARMRGAQQALTPVVDVAREPRWGRVEETFGEDPYLVSRLGVAAVRGFQGDATFSDKKRVVATLKHFAAHGQPESGMNCAPVNTSERTLRDTFLMPFRAAIQEANAMSVMASYNEIDGVPSHANQWLLRNVLRGEWKFSGFVVSDYYAIAELHLRPEATTHAVAKDKADASRLAVRAGVNIEMPEPDCYKSLADLVKEGALAESEIDELVLPLLRMKFQLGLFEDPYVSTVQTMVDKKLEQERALALQSAHETITLLKNDNAVLPLKKKAGRTIAVIGPNADRVMLGGYSGVPKYYVSLLDGIRAAAGKEMAVVYSEGCKITVGGSWQLDAVAFPTEEEDRASIAEAVRVARSADIVILALGDNEQTSREAWSRVHMGDRADLDLFGRQNELVTAIAATGTPIVTVLFIGRPTTMTVAGDASQAILECWYLGQETGTAIADILFGAVAPSGKLPISIPRSAGHLPSYYNYKPSARRGYLADDVSPLYPFGFGLSYTSFRFSGLTLQRSSIRKNESTTVSIDVKNTGVAAGSEVVQMYIRDVVSSVTRPVKELKGFAKIFLNPGESKTVTLTIAPEHLSFTDIGMRTTVEAGEFEIMVGNSSQDSDLHRTMLTVTE